MLAQLLAWVSANPEKVGMVCGVVSSAIIGRIIVWPTVSWLKPESDNLAKAIGAVLAAVVVTAAAQGAAAIAGGTAFAWSALGAAAVAAVGTSKLAYIVWRIILKFLERLQPKTPTS